MDALHALLERAQAERNLALASFNQLRSRFDAARAQATQLEAYRADYERRWSAQFAQGAALQIVRCYQDFSQRLQTAIAQQGFAVAQAQAAVAKASDALTAHELRVASVRRLIERRAQAERQLLARRERKADDEYATRVALARGGNALGSKGG
jgi:flagellar protein FliJ